MFDGAVGGVIDQSDEKTPCRVDIEDIDASGILFESADAAQLDAHHVCEDRPVGSAMGDDDHLLPGQLGDQFGQSGGDAGDDVGLLRLQ